MKLSNAASVSLAWIAAAVILFWGLGSVPLTDVDEGAFSEATREMLARGDFVSPWLLDAPRFDKPVLIHWLQMASMALFGINPWGARLPSAIAGLFWIAALASWAALLAEKLGLNVAKRRVFVWTLLVSVTSLGVPIIARAATADALLNALLAWALLFCFRALYEEKIVLARRSARAAAVCVGLGLLTKGPVAVLIPGASLAIAAVCCQMPGVIRVLVLIRDPWVWVLAIAIPTPWYVLQYQAQGMAFIEGFLGQHNLGRFSQTMHGFSAGPWYYPAWILLALLPWAPSVLGAAWRIAADRQFRGKFVWLPLANFLFVIVFFSFSATKLPHYGFYGLPGLVVLVGLALTVSLLQKKSVWVLIQRLWLVLLLVGLSTLPLWTEALPGAVKSAYYAAVLQDVHLTIQANPGWFIAPLLAAVVVAFAPGPSALAVGGLALMISLHSLVMTPAIESFRGPIRDAARIIVDQKLNAVTWRLSSPSLSFEAGRVIPPSDPAPGISVVLYDKDLAALVARFRDLYGREPAFQVIWQRTGLKIITIG